MSRSRSRRPRRRYAPAPPRTFWRRLLDYALTAVLLGLFILVAARLDRFETRKQQGTAIVNDGDSITLVPSASACAASTLRNTRRHAARKASIIPAASSRGSGWCG